MRIAVNARLLIKNKLDGIGWYSYETLRRISLMHPEHQFLFLFDRPFDPEFVFNKNVMPVIIRPPARHPLLWFFWFEFSVPLALKKYKADIFFSPDGFMSLGTNVQSLIVIHDINFFHRPMDLPLTVRSYYNHFFPRFAKKAFKICTVSEFSKRDIASSFNVPLEKIDVHYNGVNTLFLPAEEKFKSSIRKKYTEGKPFFIYIGSLHPRKNLVNLLKAFDHFRGLSGKEYRIVIAGRNVFLNNEMERTYRKMVYKNDVIFTGQISATDLVDLLPAAEALTFVSHYEGFGLPVLEAMMCDIPVIISDRTSLPEIAGDAALYADPDDFISISNAMRTLVFTPGIRNELIEKGRLRVQQFSWDKTAEGLWKSIETVMK